ncbi:DNA mismatch repair protein Msh6 [Araneus ventricosus]|uniref:DNA mismatch repair protein Msh6 n=1 Tax=Araneus ventricosus TaxID=182803 RepID=A0A4Y2FUN0_ARAVE|nr:DNA mismatch repair protein Msh6 [Araneus ventricosus]
MNHILNSIIEAKHVDENAYDEILMEFDDYLDIVALKDSDFSEFSPENTRVDEFFYEIMNASKCRNLWKVVEMLLLLSHGQATVEKGLSFSKKVVVENMEDPSPDMISNRLDAIDDLIQIPEVVEAAVAILKKIPDLERLLSKIHTYGFARSQYHPESRAIYYEAETYNKRKINDFLSTLEGFKQTSEIISMFKPHLNDFKSVLLKKCVSSEENIGHFPDMTNELKYFEEAFDHEVAKKQGNIIPSPGVDKEYDFATAEIAKMLKEFDTFLAEQRRSLNCKVSYVGTGKNRYMLEVPENRKVPSEFEFQGGRKGFKRYYTKETKDLLARLTSAEESRASALRDITRRIFAHFDQNYKMWKTAVQCISTFDVLISLVLYYKSSGVPMCRPKFFFPNEDIEPHLEIIEGRHPTFLKYFTGDDYIPNSVYIGPKRDNKKEDVNSGGRLVLVTGPNMGGKSTLMRQAGTLIIMAHLGSYVPAESMSLTPVDRIFTRVGASDQISKDKALILNSKLSGLDDFKASSGWLEKFKIRHGIRQLNIEAEKMSADVVAGDSIIAEIEKLIKEENLSLEQIYNCDETELYWKALLEKTLAAVHDTSAYGRKRMKDTVTVLACSNASGSHKLKLAVVGKSRNPRCFKNVNRSALPAHYLNQKNAWMDSQLFSKWFFDIFVPSVKSWQEKANLNGVLLLFDNCPPYPDTDFLKSGNIQCLFLPPNATSAATYGLGRFRVFKMALPEEINQKITF